MDEINEYIENLNRYPTATELASNESFFKSLKESDEYFYLKSYDSEVSRRNLQLENSFDEPEWIKLYRYQKHSKLTNYYLEKTKAGINPPTYMILTLVSYPCGGGESFMFQTIEWMHNHGYRVVWISFTDKEHKGFDGDIIRKENNCTFHKISGSFTEKGLSRAINLYKPHIIHTQGQMSFLSLKTLNEYRIPVIIGYHFWCGLIEHANGTWDNIDMLNKKYIIDNFYIVQRENYLAKQYVVSDFMNRVLVKNGAPEIEHILYAAPDKSQFFVDPKQFPVSERKYVTLININRLKGGDIFLDVIKSLDLPFIAVCTEKNLDGLDNEIKKNILEKGGQFLNYTDITTVYKQTKILLLPSHVDETFCRVAYESAANSIPILTTNVGFIPEMLGDSAIYLSGTDSTPWISTIRELYYSNISIDIIGKQLSDQVFKFSHNLEEFTKMTSSCMKITPTHNIMIFCPWCDMGLGIQSRGYSKILRDAGFKVHIFSFLAFIAKGKNHLFKKNPDEWLECDSLYQSFNDRERVTIQELEHFILSNNIGICIIPEICYAPIYEKIKFIKSKGVSVIAIPNVETVRKDEFSEWKIFDKILCNTKVCEQKLTEYNIDNLHYIGHYCTLPNVEKKNNPRLEFYHASGYNAVSRKQTLLMCQGFSQVSENAHLTITFSGKIPNEILKFRSDKITLISKDLSHSDIMNYYMKSDVSIMLSSHEGLGLGFYESISNLTPVISLDCPPHNEIITEKSGWLLMCTPFKLVDNNQAIVTGYTFNPICLKNKIEDLIRNPEQLLYKSESIRECRDEWDLNKFVERFLSGIFQTV